MCLLPFRKAQRACCLTGRFPRGVSLLKRNLFTRISILIGVGAVLRSTDLAYTGWEIVSDAPVAWSVY